MEKQGGKKRDYNLANEWKMVEIWSQYKVLTRTSNALIYDMYDYAQSSAMSAISVYNTGQCLRCKGDKNKDYGESALRYLSLVFYHYGNSHTLAVLIISFLYVFLN